MDSPTSFLTGALALGRSAASSCDFLVDFRFGPRGVSRLLKLDNHESSTVSGVVYAVSPLLPIVSLPVEEGEAADVLSSRICWSCWASSRRRQP